jgi:hypothetical protein
MDANTGELYRNRNAALRAGVRDEDIVEIRGTNRAIKKVSNGVKFNFEKARKRRKAQRSSRRRNR